jgi:hypothetical protein
MVELKIRFDRNRTFGGVSVAYPTRCRILSLTKVPFTLGLLASIYSKIDHLSSRCVPDLTLCYVPAITE